jgi:hypothetical protein
MERAVFQSDGVVVSVGAGVWAIEALHTAPVSLASKHEAIQVAVFFDLGEVETLCFNLSPESAHRFGAAVPQNLD